jgi:peptidoglycan/LPS O-acetylase OafA/YrhL
MRALGVTLVLVYHFFPEFLPGGFIGVDIFFVVSGYLITSILLRSGEAGGRVKLLDFLRRRFRRLFPAILTMLLTTLPLSLLISSDFRVDVGRQAAAVLSWTTNWYEIVTGQSYEAQLLPHLYIHTWTLSVEMQYYIVWGAVCAFVFIVFSKTRTGIRAGVTRGGVLAAAILISAASLLLMNLWAAGSDDPSAAYLSTPSHFYPLMIGSAFACLGGFAPLPCLIRLAKHKTFSVISVAFTCLGIALMVWMSFSYSFDDPRVYSYGLFVLSVISGAILLLAGLIQKANPQGRPSKPEWAITNYIGLRSYSIYLYHWPVMIIAQQLASELVNGAAQKNAVLIATIIAIPITFAAAELSYRFVEQKFRVKSRGNAGGENSIQGGAEQANAEHRSAEPANRKNINWRSFLTAKQTRIAVACVSLLALGGLSIDAVYTAPRMSSIEADLKYGAMKLDVRQLKEIHKWLVKFKPDAPEGATSGEDATSGGAQDG